MATAAKTRKTKKNIPKGIAFVQATFNNTIVTITDVSGNVISWSSAGAKGFKGSRKSTPFAAQVAAQEAGEKAAEQGVRTLTIRITGPGSGRDSVARALQATGLRVDAIYDDTPVPFNGCRAPKKRRV